MEQVEELNSTGMVRRTMPYIRAPRAGDKRSQEGVQFCKGFGNRWLLRYKVTSQRQTKTSFIPTTKISKQCQRPCFELAPDLSVAGVVREALKMTLYQCQWPCRYHAGWSWVVIVEWC